MFALERQKKILEILSSDGAVSVSRLSIELGVTEETVRRDLEKLEKQEWQKPFLLFWSEWRDSFASAPDGADRGSARSSPRRQRSPALHLIVRVSCSY